MVNNVETFANATKLLLNGAACYTGVGTPASKGTKLLSISGDCERPGVYEFPFGVTVREVLAECGAGETQAVQVSGPSGHLVPERDFERRLAFEDLAPGGSFMIFGKDRDLLEVLRNFSAFFAHESCGFCTPCRVGTSLLSGVVGKVADGEGSESDLAEVRDLAQVMRAASHCGLGYSAPNAVLDGLEKFPALFGQRLRAPVMTTLTPAFDLDSALEGARQLAARIGV